MGHCVGGGGQGGEVFHTSQYHFPCDLSGVFLNSGLLRSMSNFDLEKVIGKGGGRSIVISSLSWFIVIQNLFCWSS